MQKVKLVLTLWRDELVVWVLIYGDLSELHACLDLWRFEHTYGEERGILRRGWIRTELDTEILMLVACATEDTVLLGLMASTRHD